MGYWGSIYQRGVVPVEFYVKTKRDAVRSMSETVKNMQPYYKSTGFKKEGTIKDGFIRFKSEIFGTDYAIQIKDHPDYDTIKD